MPTGASRRLAACRQPRPANPPPRVPEGARHAQCAAVGHPAEREGVITGRAAGHPSPARLHRTVGLLPEVHTFGCIRIPCMSAGNPRRLDPQQTSTLRSTRRSRTDRRISELSGFWQSPTKTRRPSRTKASTGAVSIGVRSSSGVSGVAIMVRLPHLLAVPWRRRLDAPDQRHPGPPAARDEAAGPFGWG